MLGLLDDPISDAFCDLRRMEALKHKVEEDGSQRSPRWLLDSLDSAFADFDTETAKLDLPHVRSRRPEAIKRYLEFRLRQVKMLVEAVEDYVEERYPATGGHS